MSKEAMKLALEALEDKQSDDPYPYSLESKAINALREALAKQPAQQEPVGCEGAIVNGRVYADRLEHDYKFECEAGPLHLCTDWVEFRRCFEWLAQHTSPPAQQPAQQEFALKEIEQYRLQMAGISTAAIGYWKEGDGIHPAYDTVALRDVAKLYAKYDELYRAQRAWVGLTDEEADELVQRFARYELLRAIEAKLKEKNT